MNIEKIYNEIAGDLTEVPENWVSLSALRPIQQQDHFLLWAKHWAEEIYGFQPDPAEFSMLAFNSRMGGAFELRYVQDVLKAKPEDQVLEHDHDCRTAAGFRKSLEALHSDAQLLTKVGLWGGPDVKLYGTADICARAGYLRKVFKNLPLDDPDDTWIVCDCKFSARLDHRDHRAQYEINATQIRAYSLMVSRAMGGAQMATKALLFTKDSPYAPIVVHVGHEPDGSLDPQIANLRDQAIDIKINGWQYRPWRSDPKVPINFSNSQSEPWIGLKKRFKELMLPLEVLPGIGKTKADALRAAGHYNLRHMLDYELDGLVLRSVRGIGPVTEKKIKAALLANKTGKPSAFSKHVLPITTTGALSAGCSVFLDFEFFPGIHCPLENHELSFEESLKPMPMIFMAGVGVEDGSGKFTFRSFRAANEDHQSEKRLLQEMLDYLSHLGVFNPGRSSSVYHFGHAEVDRCREAAARHGAELDRLTKLPLVDLQAVFSRNFIWLPSAWGQGLKEISRAISKLSPEHAVTYPVDLSEAAVAMCMGWAAYESPEPDRSRLLDKIEKYLFVDCEGMWQALRWLRANAASDDESKRDAAAGRERMKKGWYNPNFDLNKRMSGGAAWNAGWYEHGLHAKHRAT